MDTRGRRSALRSFLTECRARLRPEDVGLTPVGRRRVPGLRREEVAELAEISPAWYTLLETARDIRVSPRMLDRLATALRLSDDEKMYLFSLAIDELPTIPRVTPESVGTIGREYFELKTFANRSRLVSTVQELADLTTDLLFDFTRPVEDAYFIRADLAAGEFVFTAQRASPRFRGVPSGSFQLSSVHDAKEVLVNGGLFAEQNVGSTQHAAFGERARELGAGRFMSKGIKGQSLDAAIGYFQRDNTPYSEHECDALGLIAEIVYLALASRT